MKRRRYQPAVSALVCLTIFLTNCLWPHRIESSIWAERRMAPQLIDIPTPRPPTTKPQIAPIANVPAFYSAALRYGNIRSIVKPFTIDAKKTVLFIQDIHMNDEAQSNISKALQSLFNSNKLDLIGVEGAFGPIDLMPHRTLLHRDTIQKTANDLLKENAINGPLHAALLSKASIPLVGVDDRVHYENNVRAYQESASLLPKSKQNLEKIKRQLQTAKAKLNPTLLALIEKSEAFHNGKLDVTEWAKALAVPVQNYPALNHYVEAVIQENKLNEKAVAAERDQMIAELFKSLGADDNSALLKASFDYRAGHLPHSAFYALLKNLCLSTNLDLNRFPEMKNYFDYVALTAAVDTDRLFKDIERAEKDSYDRLIQSRAERETIDQLKQFYLGEKILDFSLSKEEWKQYKSLKHVPSPGTGEGPGEGNYSSPSLTRPPATLSRTGRRNTHLEEFERFYLHAEHRDEAMASNLLRSMKENNSDSAAIIAGGFHFNGVSERLLREGITVVAFVPTLTNVSSKNGTAYLSVFNQEKTPLDKLFDGEKLFLSPQVWSASRRWTLATRFALVEKSLYPLTQTRELVSKLLQAGKNLPIRIYRIGKTSITFVFNRQNGLYVSIQRLSPFPFLWQFFIPLSLSDWWPFKRALTLNSFRNKDARDFVSHYFSFTGASDMEILDETDNDRLENEAVEAGELIRLPDGNLLGRSHELDVARLEGRTRIVTKDPADEGLYNRWQHSAQHRLKMDNLIGGSMRGQKMYVIPYLMGPEGSPYAQVGIQVTNSRYVALNMIRMTKVGRAALRSLKKETRFVKAVHSRGDLNTIKTSPPYTEEEDERNFIGFPDEDLIMSYGSDYGGNALLAKKFHALRLASYRGWKEGWLAEHMLILGIEDLKTGKKEFIAAPFPSASGKTNLAMLLPPKYFEGRYKVWMVGDDIAWLRKGKDGYVYAINPENGMFGVVPGTNMETNPNAMAAIGPGTKTLFTNVAYNVITGELWWEGKTKDKPTDIENWRDWKGNQITAETKEWAHPNSRFTTWLRNAPNFMPSPRYGVRISAILAGGRSLEEPLIRELPSVEEGIYDIAMMGVQTTAAAEGPGNQFREDPMAMRPFMAYNESEYFRHWYNFFASVKNPPLFFHVNWFLKDDDGKFIWPGFDKNFYVLLWVLKRANPATRPQTKAPLQPNGYIPDAEELGINHLGIPQSSMIRLLGYKDPVFVKDMERRDTYLTKFTRLPEKMLKAHETTWNRVKGIQQPTNGQAHQLSPAEDSNGAQFFAGGVLLALFAQNQLSHSGMVWTAVGMGVLIGLWFFSTLNAAPKPHHSFLSKRNTYVEGPKSASSFPNIDVYSTLAVNFNAMWNSELKIGNPNPKIPDERDPRILKLQKGRRWISDVHFQLTDDELKELEPTVRAIIERQNPENNTSKKLRHLTFKEELFIGKALHSKNISPKQRYFLAHLLAVMNIGLVRTMASSLVRKELQEEAYAVGLLSLYENAVPQYKFEFGYKFSTYATWWIRQAIFRWRDENLDVRIPIYLLEIRRKFKEKYKSYFQKHNHYPPVEEMAFEHNKEILGIMADDVFKTFTDDDIRLMGKGAKAIESFKERLNEEQYKALKQVRLNETILNRALTIKTHTLSMDNRMSADEDDQTYQPADKKQLSPLQFLMKGDSSNKISTLFRFLGEREEIVLNKRYGISDGVPQTLKQIGNFLGITRERVRQIQVKAIKRLRKIAQQLNVKEIDEDVKPFSLLRPLYVRLWGNGWATYLADVFISSPLETYLFWKLPETLLAGSDWAIPVIITIGILFIVLHLIWADDLELEGLWARIPLTIGLYLNYYLNTGLDPYWSTTILHSMLNGFLSWSDDNDVEKAAATLVDISALAANTPDVDGRKVVQDYFQDAPIKTGANSLLSLIPSSKTRYYGWRHIFSHNDFPAAVKRLAERRMKSGISEAQAAHIMSTLEQMENSMKIDALKESNVMIRVRSLRDATRLHSLLPRLAEANSITLLFEEKTDAILFQGILARWHVAKPNTIPKGLRLHIHGKGLFERQTLIAKNIQLSVPSDLQSKMLFLFFEGMEVDWTGVNKYNFKGIDVAVVDELFRILVHGSLEKMDVMEKVKKVLTASKQA